MIQIAFDPEKYYSELVIDGRIILKWILNKMEGCGLD
jgi:hypothetical protein